MKAKSFVTGLIIGSILTTTISVTAQNQKVEAWLTDKITLNIDGNDMTLPSDMHMVNYENRMYAPVRYIVEQMGGTIEYDADAARVTVKKPNSVAQKTPVEQEKPVEEKKVEEPVEEETVEEEIAEEEKVSDANKSFTKAPMKLRIQDVTFNVFSIERSKSGTSIYFDLNNENSYSIELDYRNAYIEIDGTRYPALFDANLKWIDGIESNREFTDERLSFEPIPDDIKRMEVVIPVIMQRYDYEKGYVTESKAFNFPIEFED